MDVKYFKGQEGLYLDVEEKMTVCVGIVEEWPETHDPPLYVSFTFMLLREIDSLLI